MPLTAVRATLDLVTLKVRRTGGGGSAESERGSAVFRNFVVAPVILGVLSQVVVAQDWAAKMFQESSHEFGTVARAAKSEYVFEMQNIYKETIHIAGVRASCGCATPKILKPTLETWEKGGILVEFNTRSFLGQRKATITVTIDKPYYAEVQLMITGFIRGDVVFDPGTINFESVDSGESATQTVSVSYAGRSDWKIVDVRSANQNLVVEPIEKQRLSGRVGYELRVQLKPDAPPGYFNDQMILITNDQQQRQIPLRVEGNVLSPLTVSPASLALGVIEPGQSVSRKIVVQSKKPFRITRVVCPDGCFEFQPSDEAKALHLIPVKFTAGQDDGEISREIQIETDLGSGATGAVLATATVRRTNGS